MKSIDIKFGYSCNNNCLHCVTGDRRNTAPDITTEEAFELLERFRPGTDEVIITGGEFTIRPDALEIIQYAKRIGYEYITLQTNGRIFSSKESAKSFKKAGIDIIVVAILGSTPEIHNKLTQSRSFNQTIAGIKNLKEIGIHVITNTVTTKINMHNLPDLTRLLHNVGVPLIQFAFPHIVGNAARNADNLIPRKTELAPFIHKSIAWGTERGIKFIVEAMPYCLMRGYECSIAEQYTPKTSVWQAGEFIEDFNSIRKTSGKAKGPQCIHCGFNSVCEGPWREYCDLFGWEEFKPIPQMTGISPFRYNFRPLGLL